jgi:hypothetical protein
VQYSTIGIELRKHHRARLEFPIRIRWRGPLGMRFETARTIDVSRDGLLVRRSENFEPHARMWVLFPFDSADAVSAQPETLARVMRAATAPDGGSCLALQLELPERESPRRATEERRKSPRSPFALPVFVRPAGTPWPEESMTQDISRDGVRFESSVAHAPGEAVFATIAWAEWAKAGEMAGRVVRVETPKDELAGQQFARATDASPALSSVAVQWVSSDRSLDAETVRRLRHAIR